MRKIGERRTIMAKNQINFTKMDEMAMAQVQSFKTNALLLAQEDLRFKSVMKPLKAQLDTILTNRENDLAQGLSLEDVLEKYPRVEVDNAIRKAENEHKAISEPMNKAMRETYVFIPNDLFDAYKKKINEQKRGDFLDSIKVFLGNLGLEELKQGQISKFAETMSDRFGARYAQSKKIVEDGVLTTNMSKAQFSKLFMATFCDLFIKTEEAK